MRNIRKELGKLIAYAQAHSIKVFFHEKGDSAGEWALDGSTIFIYTKKPLYQYCVLLHELAHNRQFIKDGRTIPVKIEKAIHKETYLEFDEILDKKYRKIIYDTEKNDSKHQLDIHYETKSTIPVEIIKREIEYDLWQYEVYYKTGSYPKYKVKQEMKKYLTKKWKTGKVK